MVLTGVNIGDFGRHQGENLATLIRRLEQMKGPDRIRLSSIEPDLLSDEIIELIADSLKYPMVFDTFGAIPVDAAAATAASAFPQLLPTPLPAEAPAPISVSRQRYEAVHVYARNHPLGGEIPSPLAPPSGCRFRTRCPRADQVCKDQVPEMAEVAPHQYVACHHPLAPGESATPVTLAGARA